MADAKVMLSLIADVLGIISFAALLYGWHPGIDPLP